MISKMNRAAMHARLRGRRRGERQDGRVRKLLFQKSQLLVVWPVAAGVTANDAPAFTRVSSAEFRCFAIITVLHKSSAGEAAAAALVVTICAG